MAFELRSRLLITLFVAILLTIIATGCCTRKKVDKTTSVKTNSSKTSSKKVKNDFKKKPIKKNNGNGLSYEEKKARRQKTETYRNLERANQMFERSNYESALRQVKRVQLENRDNPYIMMKSWYLSAMIYHKMGKSSRRKRAMRKMVDSLKKARKDPRYQAAVTDGLMASEFIGEVKKNGGKRFEEIY
jgi:hypothetical protein